MNIRIFIFCLTAVMFSNIQPILAENFCDHLKNETAVELQNAVFNSVYLYDCEDITLADSLKKEEITRFSQRLRKYTCSLIQEEKSQEMIIDILNRRGMSMMDLGNTYSNDTSYVTFTGNKNSDVILTAYICPMCPFCKIIIPALYKEIITGRLKGKIKFAFFTFPIKHHKGSLQAALALQSAVRLNKGWEYLLKLYETPEISSDQALVEIGTDLGLDGKTFSEMIASEETRQQLIVLKKSGVRNDVRETPSFFINGKKYVARLDVHSLIDVLEEEYDRVSGVLCQP